MQAIGQLLWETPPWKGQGGPQAGAHAQWEGGARGLEAHPLEGSRWGFRVRV